MEQDGAAHILSLLTDRAAGKWQALREQYRKQKIVTVIAPYPDGLWAADVRRMSGTESFSGKRLFLGMVRQMKTVRRKCSVC